MKLICFLGLLAGIAADAASIAFQSSGLWSAESIYTSEFALNGKEWRNWLGFQGVPAASALKTDALHVSSEDGKHWWAVFVPGEKRPADYELCAALLVSETSSDVKGGKKAGRHLNHDFAALSLITRPLASQTNGMQGKFVIDDSPKGVTGRLALAVWVTHSGHLEPLQATGGWLPEPGKMNLSLNQSTQTQK